MSNASQLTPHIAYAASPIFGDINIMIERIGGWPRLSVVMAFVFYMAATLITCMRTGGRQLSSAGQSSGTVALITYDPDAA
jgi:hypothetical protein